MPRKKQTVQTKKRQKTYNAGEMSGEATHVKPKGAFKLFSNYPLFAAIGVIAITAGLLLAVLLGGGSQQVDSEDNGVRGAGVIRTTPQAGETATSDEGGAANTIVYTSPPPMSIDASKTYTAVIKTEKGDITVELDPSEAPQAVNNFVFLANEDFYDGVPFWRVVVDDTGSYRFAQSGDPTGTGNGGSGYELPYEPTTASFEAGTLAVARKSEASAPNNGSQFFFTYQEEPSLDGEFTIFGRVTDGLDVLEQLTPRDPRPGEAGEPAVNIDSIDVSES